MVYILTGDIQTGKSYALNAWLKNKSNVVGLLSLCNTDGTRNFTDIRNKQTFSMHANDKDTEEQKIYVGRFIFSKLAFEMANSIIQFEVHQTDYTYLIVDELGKLELKQSGLYVSTRKLATKFEGETNTHLILVVRSALLDQVIEHYNLKPHKILHKADLKLL
ncbi:MAG: hypothetical protein GW839_11175 [Flavobacteriales bacterium]|nr:hypothetical protein [Flavobacteriia bacterium]NCP06124.1 hypothetical protein [Flavobacteriales bacterium]PIV93375.1 MAG: hypothetical protein COW44_09790 [Flavobacteriaceae bacterium CG17_big_fil_post_rev_8_21_14_2_50_33_15]PIY12445.1 MAG: hypothetical protein COZ17_03535 [Flavobacteriaceae bacterium CG_4_10_14_3_um_filter_33_47]PJB18766.1 MAG: hypothetical protein CO117_07165 [Flavobacteriaceae bacterium CG_4_9_14_3_um_filter_33_16]